MLLLNADYRVVWGGVKGWNVATVVFWHKKAPLRRGFLRSGGGVNGEYAVGVYFEFVCDMLRVHLYAVDSQAFSAG